MECSSFCWESGLGLETIVHLLPFQCSIRVKRGRLLGFSKKPTAHTLVEERANTPSSSTLANCAGGFGLGTMLHLVPSQCSIKVCLTKAAPPGSGPKPTAQMSVEETTATALSLAPNVLLDTLMVGLGTTFQLPVTGVVAACALVAI